MADREIKVPKVFHELHGENTRLSNIIIVYLAGILTASLIFYSLHAYNLPTWKLALISLLYFDMAGGVVANLSTSTNQYYQKNRNLRIVFLLLHIAHPALFILVFSDYYQYFAFVGAFTLLVGLFLNSFKDIERQQNFAAFFVVIGITISFYFKVPINILYTFAPIYMTKLLLGFSVKRPSFF
jgi:hypothetical protein